jgi:hypothetical protein
MSSTNGGAGVPLEISLAGGGGGVGGDDDRDAFAAALGGAAGFEVAAITSCPHVALGVGLTEAALPPAGSPLACSTCGDASEAWVCLACGHVGCSRFVASHGAAHHESSGHPLAVGLADMSTWCYACAAYLDVFNLPALHPPFRLLYRRRFDGEEPALPPAAPAAGSEPARRNDDHDVNGDDGGFGGGRRGLAAYRPGGGGSGSGGGTTG